ncbi:MAG: hypothetical protein FWF19_05835 [Euryarchaeota archaeon]|nr:hypothetical protein [Euryarchaeota archaeon]
MEIIIPIQKCVERVSVEAEPKLCATRDSPPRDLDEPKKEFETWIKNAIAELLPQETKEIKKELSDLTYAIKELTERIDNLERKI